MILAKNEIILNEWDYATSNKYKAHTQHTLTVTNKRLVSSVANKRGVSRREVAIDAIQNISLRHEKPSKRGPILRILLSLIIIGGCVASIMLFKKPFVLPVALFVCLLGLGMFLDAVLDLNQGFFYIELSTNQVSENAVMSVGYEKLKQRLYAKRKYRIRVDNENARDIIERLGSYIFEQK